MVQTWLDSHICLIVKNPYALVCKINSSWCETVGRTSFCAASFYSSYMWNGAKVRVDPTVVRSCFCPRVPPLSHPWLWSSDRASVPCIAIPADPCSAVCSLTIGGTFIVSRISFTVCALRSESSEQQMSFKKMPAAICQPFMHFTQDPHFMFGFFLIHLEFGWAGF